MAEMVTQAEDKTEARATEQILTQIVTLAENTTEARVTEQYTG